MDAAARLVSFSLLLTFSFVMFSDGYSRNVTSRPAIVNVGAIFAFDSSIGRVSKIAIEEAIKDVNADPNILSGTKLVVTMENSDRSGFLGIAGALQFMGTDTVAILGPQSSAISRIVCFAANELQVPLLSFAATDPTLNSLQFPFFVRTTQSDLYQMAAVAEIVYYYEWRQVIAIFVDDDYGQNGVSALGDKLAARRCKISYKAGIRPDSEVSHDDIMYLLVKVALMESRVVILHVYPKLGLKIFSVAKDLGMMGNGYVWIATDWLSTILDSTSLPSETLDTVQGVLSLRQHTPNSKRKKAFASRWKKLTGASLGLNSYGLYAYDSVWLVAHAIDLFFNQGGVISFSNDSRLLASEGNLHLDALSIFDGGQLLLNNVLQSNFVGLTGPIKFNSDKSLILPAYDIINVIGSGFRQIGYWSNYSGLSVVPPETLYSSPSNHSIANQRLRFAIWPGETMTKPRGWVFPNYGKQLRIGVPIRVSFREFVSRVQGTDEFKGFCIDVFTAALKLLPYPVAYQFIPFGDGKKNPSYTELVNSISNGLLDAAIGDIAIVKNRTRIVDFTQPYAASGLVIVAPLRRLNSGAWAFLQPFSARMWIVTSCFFIIIGIVVWILEHRINDEFRGPPRRQVITVLWFSLSTLFFAHRENTVSTLARIVLLIWLSVILIINSSYTASLTSILTVKQLSSPIKGLETLMKNDERIGYQTGSFAEHYLIEELGFPKSRLVELGSPKAYAEALQKGPDNGGVAAVVDELPYVQLFLSTECDFKIVGEEFTKSGWGFAFPRDSPLAVDMSIAILALSENGELQRIHDKWLMSSACNSDTSQVESDRLELKSFWGLYLICAVAFLVSLLIYFIRIMRQSYRATPMESDSPARGSSRSRCLQRVLTLMDEKKLESSSGNKKRKVAKSLSENHVDFVSWRE